MFEFLVGTFFVYYLTVKFEGLQNNKQIAAIGDTAKLWGPNGAFWFTNYFKDNWYTLTKMKMTAYEFFEIFGLDYTKYKVYTGNVRFQFTDRYQELLENKKIY